MKAKSRTALFLAAALFPAAVLGECGEAGFCRGQDEAAADGAFSLEAGLFSISVIRECLGSFRALTEEAEGKIPPAKLKAIGNTGWEMQTLGFANHPGFVEGALLSQDVTVKRLQRELVGLKLKDGAAGEKDLLEAEEALEASRRAFEEFKTRFRVVD